MAILRGRDGTVTMTLDGTSTTLGEVKSFSLTTESDTLETTAMGTGGWKTYIGSLQSWSGSVEIYVDSTDGTLPVSAVVDDTTGAAINVTLTDGTSGNSYAGTAVVTSVNVDVSSADLVTANLDLTGSGALTIT